MKVAELLVRCLENEGVSHVFGVPGEETEDLQFALDESSIEFVPARHEQGAAFIANVWGRLTGKAGVCLATLGPGATNLFTGVADANLDKAPVVAITGQGGLSRLHHESHQNLDVVSMFRPITKWTTAITSPETVTEIVRKAFKMAEYEKPGATHVELSEDVAQEEVADNVEPLPVRRVRRPGPDHKAIEATLDLLRNSRRPLIIAGNGAIRKLASAHLTRLVERYRIPVAATFMGKGAVSDESPLSLMAIGLGFRDYVMEAVDAADVIITVGYDIAELPPDRWNPEADTPIVHIDFLPAEVHSHYVPEVEVVGDISGSLWELNRALANEHLDLDSGWFVPIRERIHADIASYADGEGGSMTIPRALGFLRQELASDGIVISDVGSHKMWVARNFPTFVPNGCVISNGLASMGIAVPGAIAASLAHPDRQVVAVVGDGGFMMNAQELETAHRLGLGFTVLLLNDDDYGLISWKQQMSAGRSAGTRITNPDFVRFAESHGIAAYRATDEESLRRPLGEGLRSGRLQVIEVPVDASVNMELVEKLRSHWSG